MHFFPPPSAASLPSPQSLYSRLATILDALQEQINASGAGLDSTVGESSPPEKISAREKTEENYEHMGLNIEQVPVEEDEPRHRQRLHEFSLETSAEAAPNVEHQFISSFAWRSSAHEEEKEETRSLLALRNDSEEDVSFSLQLGEPEPKRRKQSGTVLDLEKPEMN